MTRPLSLKRAGAPLRVERRSGPLSAASVLDTGAGCFAGYASVFGQADDQGDIVSPGAFASALQKRGTQRIAMLYQHETARPVGVWTSLREDDQGLWVEGKLALDADDGRDAHALLKAGALTGLSIGFHAVTAERRPGGGRLLHEIDLWEISLVTFPMLNTARVAHVKQDTHTSAFLSAAQSHALARAMRRATTALTPKHATGKGAPSA